MSNERYLHLIRQDCPLPVGAHVLAYCRDSGGEEQDRSVQQQLVAIQEYCAKHQLILERTYFDEAKTGSDAEKRSQLNQMQMDIAARFRHIRNLDKRKKHMEKYPFGLVVWKSNRLGRDSIETTHIKSDLRLRGITIIPLIASVETGDPSINALFEVVQALQDEKLLQEQSDNTRRGLADIVTLRDNDPGFRAYNPDWPTHDGRYLSILPGPPPVGFKAERLLVGVRDRKGRNHGGEKHYVQRIVPDHEDGLWDRCRLAWKMRHEGLPIKKIMEATRLYKNTSGYTHFFENRIYTGVLVYGGHVLENFVEPLIESAWWEEEQQRRAERAAKQKKQAVNPLHEPRRVASRHLLTGLVFCGAKPGEEHPMNADTVPAREGKRSRWDFYICTHKKNSRDQACQAGRVGAAALDQAVIDNLMEHVLTVDNLRPIAEALATSLVERNRDVSTRIAAVQAELDEVQTAIRKLIDALEKLGLSTSIQARLQEREAEERRLIAELVTLEDVLVKPKDIPKIGEEQLQEWIASIRAALTGDDVDLARQAIRQFVAKIVVNEKAGTIFYTFPLSYLSRLRNLTLTGFRVVNRFNLAA